MGKPRATHRIARAALRVTAPRLLCRLSFADPPGSAFVIASCIGAAALTTNVTVITNRVAGFVEGS